MSTSDWRIDLSAVHFERHEQTLLESNDFSVTTFAFRSGVKALRVRTDVTDVLFLPFHGQQVWDLTCRGRRLTMGSVFEEPVQTREYLGNYGAMFLHCGATAMGNPGPSDTHPPHGELPNAPFQFAYLIGGTEGDAPFVGLTGQYDHRVSFSTHYSFVPTVTLLAGATRLDCSLAITNLRSRPMDLMYLAHINFRPEDGSHLVDTVPDSPDHQRLRRKFARSATSEPFAEYLDAVTADPAVHRAIVPGLDIAPELVIGLDCRAGGDGWSHALQVRPDGSADFVSHRPEELDRAVRWMTRNGNEEALGLMLPSTAEADGYTAEKVKGNVKQIAPGESFRCRFSFGSLTPEEARAMVERIAAVGA